MEVGGEKCSAVLTGRDDFGDTLPATLWLANFRLSLRDETECLPQPGCLIQPIVGGGG